MKYNFFLVLLLIAFMSSCKKAPLNKKLEGMWQLMDATLYLPDKSVDDSLYLSFQLNLVQLRKASPLNNDALGELGYYQFTGDSLHIQMKSTIEFMHKWGFESLNESFLINQFTSHKLILSNSNGYWVFRKF